MYNLFYEEPDPNRWVRGDRYVRRLIRRIVRGKSQPGGHARVFLNLCAGLNQLRIPYRVNDYRHLRRARGELACVIGKPHVLCKVPPGTPILLGAAGYSHPVDNPDLFSQHNVRTVLVPCEWMRLMWEPYWGENVQVWPVGIDTDLWRPDFSLQKDIDVLVYDKIRWRRDEYEAALLDPVLTALERKGLRFKTLRYGSYREEEFSRLVRRSRSLIFLCEHESQGIALLQALSCDVPVLAWDRGGYWQDPKYYPDRVMFSPVTTVPYWDARCGQTFQGAPELPATIERFWSAVSRGEFEPRRFMLENLTLERGARHYVEIANRVHEEMKKR
jgi:hypothetical protein